MINMNKKILIPALIISLAGFSVYGVNQASATDTTGFTSIVQRLSQKFNLNQDEIRTVFEEERAERQTQMVSQFEDRLSQDVSNGKITEAQKQAIIAKHNEIREQYTKPDNWQELSRDQRQSLMQEKRTQLENWAKENGIDTSYFFGGFGNGLKRGFGRHQR